MFIAGGHCAKTTVPGSRNFSNPIADIYIRLLIINNSHAAIVYTIQFIPRAKYQYKQFAISFLKYSLQILIPQTKFYLTNTLLIKIS